MCSIQCTKRKENVTNVGIRVTRSGEFSPFGRLFSLGRFSKITQLAQISGLLFSTVKIINFDKKNGPGYILGDFFTNSSGHPGWDFHGSIK
jgi:hypothetical protein